MTADMDRVAHAFIAALQELEESGEVDEIVATFADDCEVGNLVSPRTFHGSAGAREFWTIYRSTFGALRSDFRNVIIGDDRAALEWTSTGTNTDGRPFAYDGVSLLESDGKRITRFRAYFDPGKLGHQLQAATAGA